MDCAEVFTLEGLFSDPSEGHRHGQEDRREMDHQDHRRDHRHDQEDRRHREMDHQDHRWDRCHDQEDRRR
jgi:hypothetical protein